MKGTYLYFLNENPTGITEEFSVETEPSGEIATLSIRDASDFGTKISVRSIQQSEAFKSADIRFEQKRDDGAIDVRAVYEFSTNGLLFSRRINGEKTDDDTVDFPSHYIFFPLMRCFQGEAILRVASSGQFSNVLVPSIEDPGNTDSLLKPTFDERTANFIEQEAVTIDGRAVDTSAYQYISKHYSENSKFWIDDNGVLVRYVFNQSEDQVWSVQISDYR